MAVMTDVTIGKLIRNKQIKIAPLVATGVTPVGYDVHPSDVTMIRERGETRLVDPVDGVFVVPPGAQFLALTLEQIVLAPTVAATIHSQVRLVSLGMSHISTTVDPGWSGRLLLAMVNLSGAEIRVAADKPIATIVFHTVTARTKRPHNHRAGRADIIEQDLLSREQAKLMQLGQGVLEAAKPRLTDAEDIANRKAAADFLSHVDARAALRVTAKVMICGVLFVGGLAALLGGEPVWRVVHANYPSLDYGTYVGLLVSAIGAGFYLWTRKPTE